MRTYIHHIGDWMTHTAYCDWMESAAYHKLIMAYYVAEAPFPDDMIAVYRVVGAITAAEKEATRRALHQFFVRAPDGLWHQKRCDEEIERAQRFNESQRANINKRWNISPERENQTGVPNSVTRKTKRVVVESVGSGIETNLPRTPADASGRLRDTNGITNGIPTVIPTLNPIPLKNTVLAGDQRARDAAAACVSRGIEVGESDPRLAALIADGATPADFAAAAQIASAAGRGWAYCGGIVANRLSDAARMAQEGRKTGSGSPNYPMLPHGQRPT